MAKLWTRLNGVWPAMFTPPIDDEKVDPKGLKKLVEMQIPISKLTLGTVQLGIPYGVANKHGQPNAERSHELLDYALKHGITSLDTARQYGASEEVIGSFGQVSEFFITTKFKLSNEALTNIKRAIEEAETSVRESCKMLRIDKIPILLLHANTNQDFGLVAQILPTIVKDLQHKGLIEEGGISVFKPEEVEYLKGLESITAIQAPMNLMDTRLLQGDTLMELAEKKVKIFIRSIYLQGLLVMKNEEVPAHLSEAIKYKNNLEKIAGDCGLSMKELAFSFVRETPGVSSIVVGSDNISQLKENILLINTPSLTAEVRERILEASRDIPEVLITPALWDKLKS